jgi:Muconolactone delta-isomerase
MLASGRRYRHRLFQGGKQCNIWSKALAAHCHHHPSRRSHCSNKRSSPIFEYVIRLKTEGKILAGGVPVGDRAFVFIIEAPSNDEADRIVRDMPAWGLLEWKVTPLQSVEARAEMERKVVQALRSAC